jgi:2,3-bisphosphoglycerate-dependent phosphoglycerate mutase/probable phosphoglycerate mutase
MSQPWPSPRSIVLVRHGESDLNAAGRFVGRSDPPLNARGEGQARDLASSVARFAPEVVVASPLARARQTAALASAACPPARGVETDERLCEVDFGAWEGLTFDEARATDPAGFTAFESGRIEGFPGGESVHDVAHRMLPAVTGRDVGRALFVSHATVVRLTVAALLGLDLAGYRQALARPAPCSWTELEETPAGWRLVAYNAGFHRG